MIIKHVHIEKFRAIKDIEFSLGERITAIVGHNGTMKTTVLGILSQTFTIGKNHPLSGEKTLDGHNFRSQFSEKFKLSDKDIAGQHRWTLTIDKKIYSDESFGVHSIKRDANSIRFWPTKGKNAGDGYLQVPVHYISLKRVTPIGEENNISQETNLSLEEIEFLRTEYSQIFTSFQNVNLNVDTLISKNKGTASIHHCEHDALSISAGQDALGKILLAVLSFKRLKDKYPKDYPGGILLIDEIESTFHPMAQQHLIKRLHRYSHRYKLQIIFTTHSPSIIKSAFPHNYNNKHAKLIYLKKVGDSVMVHKDVPIEKVISELSGEVIDTKTKVSKVRIQVFTEDEIAKNMLTYLLKDYKDRIKFVGCSIGAEQYLELLRVKLEQLTNSLIVLDGDKNVKKTHTKIKNYKLSNILFLPGSDAPEKFFYNFLYTLEEDDEFWDLNLGGFDKVKCFAGFNTFNDATDTEEYKKWFKQNILHFGGKSLKKLIPYWAKKKPDEHERLVKEFKESFNRLASKMDIDLIE
ncbi:AAA family ATPase [Turicibacter sanguinis]|nr:AAA family ATPase [Turicibacter sanguinis]MTO27670.1 AAA family ATPase [Turicibacter sanguinis]MTO90611.1 AAA family ATPase [Turicibacter sanguinis]MTP70730.1 AAA family ATPase [Turicibacter sanguinis]MTQ02902.1 AAA family ATPase [Turicibacter sanguinis]